MITPNEIEKIIDDRMKRIELDVDKRLKHEIKEGAEIIDLMQLTYHIENPKLMIDKEFYAKLKENEFSVIVEKFTDSLALAKKVSKIRNAAMKKLKIPLFLSKADSEYLMQNKEVKNILDKTRIKLVKLLSKKTKKTENVRRELIKKLQTEEMKRIDIIINKAFTLAIQEESFEKDLLIALKSLEKELSSNSSIKQELVTLTESDVFDSGHLEEIEIKTNKHVENTNIIKELLKKKEDIENKLKITAKEMEKIISMEFRQNKKTEIIRLDEVKKKREQKFEKEFEKAA